VRRRPLDYTAPGWPRTRSCVRTERLCGGCFGNPHSENRTSAASTLLVEEARAAVLPYFNEYAVIFTPNATGACRLVGEAYPSSRWRPRLPDRLAARLPDRAHARQRRADGLPLRPAGQPGAWRHRGVHFLDPAGAVVDERAVARDASAPGTSVRTGRFCHPGAGEWAFGLTRRKVRGPWWHGFLRCDMETIDDYLRLIGLPSGGAVRVSLGLASDVGDLHRFLDWAERTYRDADPGRSGLAPRLRC